MWCKATMFFFLAVVSFGLASETHINAEPAHPTETNNAQWPETQPVLRFAINHFPPYSILSEGKPPAGINVIAMKLIAERLNMRLKFLNAHLHAVLCCLKWVRWMFLLG